MNMWVGGIYPLLTLVSAVIIWSLVNGWSSLDPSNPLTENEVYDYVIIGAGSAGAVVANRLSKDRKLRILVLQDGGNPNPIVDIPGLAHELIGESGIDYSYAIVKQNNSCLASGSYEGNCRISRGIGLGGTSNLFSMSVVRGNPNDYNRWAQITEDSTWAYENVLSVFKNQENYHGFQLPRDDRYHGVGGESYVSVQHPTVFSRHFFKACEELGLSTDVDANGNQTVGCGHLDVNIKQGKRWGSYQGFIKPILGRSNLKIIRYATATKINFDVRMRATGVTYSKMGQTRVVNAKLEVLLCAGAIDSPKLLMLSGIGPTDALKSVGIPQLLDLPVGTSLDDHVGVRVDFRVNTSKIGFVPDRDLTTQVLKEYLSSGKGPLASPHFNPRTLLYMTSTEFNSPNWPDIEILARGDEKDSHKFIVEVFLLRSLSSGTLKLASANPKDQPLIDPQFFSNKSDMRRLVEGLEFALTLVENTTAFQAINARMTSVPGCKGYRERKKFFECVVRQNTLPLCHPSGTVKMGAPNDLNAVLDSKLRVRGTTGLRVIDCSIMPTSPAGHTHAPALMIGEIGSRFVLDGFESRL